MGAREARGGGSDRARDAGCRGSSHRQAPSASARRALGGAQDVAGADSALAVRGDEHALRGIRARAAGRGVMDELMMGGAGAIREVPGGDSGPEGAGTWAGGGLSLQGNHWNYSRCYCKYACTAFLGYFSLPYPPALGRLNQPGTCDDQVSIWSAGSREPFAGAGAYALSAPSEGLARRI